ncbi:hypothetical protein KQ874_02875 [Mycoplasma sp. ES3157-GEN-MYC]|uniref:Uncharacterized protein n=1 Tax=Mycoplasma miroungigenitalium TaxID=754515 RepID=A0A6M4JCI8_9MOLU|nr:hypothetical protein [Mycoplasma miroungigenitalium]MBU4690622.1 hypothetical protein [Mycoplasma miroungigenitalium]MBU4691889.1 hypothetical protein [Mycoplasma miroungigenitalium]QJR43746.1 hypothetical protein HLA87_03075 [Mycoplasma miroungigenitalium]
MEILLHDETNTKKAITRLERELDDIWEQGENGADVIMNLDDQNMWNAVIKYLDEHKEEFSYQANEQKAIINVEFVL